MAAPHRGYRSTLPTQPALPPWEREPRRGNVKRKQSGAAPDRRRRFAILVVVPVLLMLGSVYLHTVAGDLDTRVAGLEEELVRARSEGETLAVEVAELSAAERVRPLARERLGMRDAGSEELEVYRSTRREDGSPDGGEKRGGEPRSR